MKSLEKILEQNCIELPNWPSTDAELDDYLSEVEGCTLGMDEHETRVTSVISRIEEDERAAMAVGGQSQQLLFDLTVLDAREKSNNSYDFTSIVRDAYLEVFDGYSTDRVIADPDRNCLFVHACWKRGAQASQGDLNRFLMNARKAKKIGKVEGVQRYSVPRAVMDSYLFASEVAVRILQSVEHFSRSRWVSLDDILCERSLGKKFVEIATSITPGYQPVDYRWAALSIRKAFNRGSRSPAEHELPRFELLGQRHNIRPSRISSEAGFFWLRSGTRDFYIGHSQQLRSQIEMLIETGFEDRLEEYQDNFLFPPEPISFSIASTPIRSVSHRDAIKRSLVDSHKPLVNVTNQGERSVA